MLYLISYDIVDDKSRARLAKKLLDFGKRVQYSVFECDLTPKQLESLKKQVLKLLDLEQDSLRIYKLCENCAGLIETHGVKTGWQEQDLTVI